MQILSATTGLPQALKVLRQGGIVAHATETCYGFACDLQNPSAVSALFTLKDRPTAQPVSALFASIEEAKKYVEWNEEAELLAAAHLPGPLTLILPLRPDAPHKLLPCPNGHPTIGVRISSHLVAQALVAEFESPISTTSANLHGLTNPYSPADIEEQFAEHATQPDLILDSGELPRVPPSTIIDLTKNKPTELRKGNI